MWIEDYTPEIESDEWWWNSAEVKEEASEKYKKSSQKAAKKVQKVKKDEKKAKKYDFLLAGFLVKILLDKKYDSLIDSIFKTIHFWYPSNFVLWILSLINLEISNKIREITNNNKIKFEYKIQKEEINWNDNNIDIKIRNRINSWVEDINLSIKIEYSEIQTLKLKELLIKNEEILINYISKVFVFFLKEINISITNKKSENIAEFILSEIKKNINKLKIEDL
jgi:hypothetical protein